MNIHKINKYFSDSRGGRETEEELNSPITHTEDGPSTGGLVETKLEPLEFSSEISLGLESLPSSSSSSQDLLSSSTSTSVTTSTTTEDTKTKLYLKPPMSPELMIAIAVRNLDPGKVVGLSPAQTSWPSSASTSPTSRTTTWRDR